MPRSDARQDRPVSAQPDSFAGFIDVVASSLDEPARADELAARLHVSRSQLDRVVSAAAGEAPGRLRRRILLERAAFRLLEDRLGILDVAVEAGYASHEAFTRAFRREYGVAPSEWRTSPGAMHLPAPNRVHFHPPGGLRLPARRKVTSMDLVLTMTEHHVWLVGQMIDRASGLDDAQLDKPIEISVEGIDRDPTARSLLSRLVGQMAMWNQAVANRPYDFAVEKRREHRLDAGAAGRVRAGCSSTTYELPASEAASTRRSSTRRPGHRGSSRTAGWSRTS